MDFKKDVYQDPDIKKYVKIISRDPRAFASLANALLNKGYVEEAIQVCEEGLLDDPDFVAGRAVLGKCYVKDGKTGKAKEEFERIIEDSSDNVVAIKGLGEIYYSMELYSDALDMYEHLLFIDPMNSEFQDMVEKLRELAPAGAVSDIKDEAVPPVEEVAESDDEEPGWHARISEDDGESGVTDLTDDGISGDGSFLDEKTVFALIDLMKKTVNLSERVLSSGYNAKSQRLFAALYSALDPAGLEALTDEFETYMDLEGKEGEIIPIERGVSPHEDASIEIAGTENIGLQKNAPEALFDKVESTDDIVSNQATTYDDEINTEEELPSSARESAVGDYAPGEDAVEDERADMGADVAELDTTLKGRADFDMEVDDGDDDMPDIPVNDIPEEIDETTDFPIAEEAKNDAGDFSEDILEENDVIEEEDIDEEEPMEEESDPGSEGGERMPFRDDSYMSLEDEISSPRDLGDLLAEAEKSVSGEDDVEPSDYDDASDYGDDIMDELESETAAYLEERQNEKFSGENVLDINGETPAPDVGRDDMFRGRDEVDVGVVDSAGVGDSRFNVREEIDVAEGIPDTDGGSFSGKDEIDVPDSAGTFAVTDTESASFSGSEELDMDDFHMGGDSAGKKEPDGEKDELFDADDEKIDDIGKWLNEL